MDILSEVKEIISNEMGISVDKINLDTNLAEDLGADSIDAVTIVSELEDRFSISLADEAIQNIKTVNDLVEYIKKSL